MRVAGPNLSTGFYASAVDLGRLQTELARGMEHLDATQLEERWDEVARWLRSALGSWVQRCKHMKLDRREQGIHIELETQDDHGYYSYAFDVFPGRGTGS